MGNKVLLTFNGIYNQYRLYCKKTLKNLDKSKSATILQPYFYHLPVFLLRLFTKLHGRPGANRLY